jgi:hypothetical protein
MHKGSKSSIKSSGMFSIKLNNGLARSKRTFVRRTKSNITNFSEYHEGDGF